jgi:hypothetical protein
MKKALVLLAAAGLLMTAGCRVQVDKDSKGGDKNVEMETPFGGLHVRSNNLSAADVGLPAYPGATQVSDDKDKSADVHVGFGTWQIHVKVVKYKTSDSQEKVLAFYQNALGRYGSVIRCQDGKAIGTPAATQEGLSCSDDNDGHVRVQTDMGQTDVGTSLRAGSRHHQHIVGIETGTSAGNTHFALVELELPADVDKNSSRSQ